MYSFQNALAYSGTDNSYSRKNLVTMSKNFFCSLLMFTDNKLERLSITRVVFLPVCQKNALAYYLEASMMNKKVFETLTAGDRIFKYFL